jgi:hypothetical protein
MSRYEEQMRQHTGEAVEISYVANSEISGVPEPGDTVHSVVVSSDHGCVMDLLGLLWCESDTATPCSHAFIQWGIIMLLGDTRLLVSNV